MSFRQRRIWGPKREREDDTRNALSANPVDDQGLVKLTVPPPTCERYPTAHLVLFTLII